MLGVALISQLLGGGQQGQQSRQSEGSGGGKGGGRAYKEGFQDGIQMAQNTFGRQQQQGGAQQGQGLSLNQIFA